LLELLPQVYEQRVQRQPNSTNFPYFESGEPFALPEICIDWPNEQPCPQGPEATY
jgi:hypothetical protein